MKLLRVAVSALLLAACAKVIPIAQIVLKDSEIACAFASDITEPAALATACQIDQALVPSILPLLSNLIAEREAAKKVGVRWNGDAGVSTTPSASAAASTATPPKDAGGR